MSNFEQDEPLTSKLTKYPQTEQDDHYDIAEMDFEEKSYEKNTYSTPKTRTGTMNTKNSDTTRSRGFTIQSQTGSTVTGNKTPSASNTTAETVIDKNTKIRYRFKNSSDQWESGDSCFICDLGFGTLKNKRHHCRLCTKSCCEKCSRSRIQKNRVCDVCDYKNSDPTYEINKKQHLRDLATKAKHLKDRIIAVDAGIREKEELHDLGLKRLDITTSELRSKLEDYKTSLVTLKNVYETKLKEKQALELVVKQREDQFNQSLMKKKEIESQVNILELEVDLLSRNYELKVAKIRSLGDHVVDLKNLEESLRFQTEEHDIKMDLLNEFLKKSMVLLQEEEEAGLLHQERKDELLLESQTFQKESLQDSNVPSDMY